MRQVSTKDITDKVRDLCISAACDLEPDMASALRAAREKEESPLGKEVLGQIIENFEIAGAEGLPMCQDTGISVFFVELGRDVALDGPLYDAVNEGVRRGYKDGFLRKSVCHPLKRINTGDNTPAIVHTSIVEGDKVKIKIAPKGAGSENMSRLKMLKPAEGVEGIKAFVVETVREAGGNPCPPIVLGVGIGGSFEKCAILAKKALLRPVGTQNPDPDLVQLEADLLKMINDLGIGPMGFGGRTTALAVHIEAHPCHIASLPVAVNIQCHAGRHKEAVI
ncbi:MAG: fumarate hydratase [Deltaproteobacteria bacterium]|nr:fumarate hydratase [Deltaproteobacteria bacterium]MBZ0219536.1 fumarate hydratase [Deltaproteobacteria bacterium]